MLVAELLVAYADPLLAIGTLLFTIALYFLVRSGAGTHIPLNSSMLAGGALWLHVVVFLALGFYWTAIIVTSRAIMWIIASVQRIRRKGA